MVFGREMVVQRGTKIGFATAPLDPRDPFRGDYVRLRYPLNALVRTGSLATGRLPTEEGRQDVRRARATTR